MHYKEGLLKLVSLEKVAQKRRPPSPFQVTFLSLKKAALRKLRSRAHEFACASDFRELHKKSTNKNDEVGLLLGSLKIILGKL